MQRFYLEKKLQKIEIFENEKFHQLSRVLRSKIGDEIVIFNENEEFVYEIKNFTKKSVELAQKSEIIRQNPETDAEITLFQAMPNKLEKIEWIIEKNTEIGVKKIVFFRSERSQKIFLAEKKIERMQEIAREALEQCGGKKPVEIIFSDEKLGKILEKKSEKNIVLHTAGVKNQLSDFKNEKNIGIWIGPEGGWSDDEMEKMNKNNFITAHF